MCGENRFEGSRGNDSNGTDEKLPMLGTRMFALDVDSDAVSHGYPRHVEYTKRLYWHH